MAPMSFNGDTLTANPAEEVVSVHAEVQRVEVTVPKQFLKTDEELKEWLWQHHKDTLLASMSIKKYENEATKLEKTESRLNLLDKIAEVQRRYLESEAPQVVFGGLLEGILQLMSSEYGFIGEVKYEADGTMYLQTHAITNIAWDAATRQFYADNAESGLKFFNMNSLFGKVMTTKESVIANNPKTDPRACGIPEGHPALDHFLGIPFFQRKGGEMIGMVGIANKPGGFSQADIDFLEPLINTCSNLIQAYRQIQENKHLINTLEEKVRGRTRELELANESLEEANRQVVRASAAQLQHFACMSHEIRTPLNCIIGMSSLLQETKLSPMQEESLRMIVDSGDLLLTVVNDVLDYSKLESGNVEIEIRQINLQETLNSIVHSIELKAKSRNLKLRTFYGASVPEFVQTDSRRLQQILYNLLGNAIKFSNYDGDVELIVSLCDPTQGSGEQGGIACKREHQHTSTASTSASPETSARTSCPFHRPGNPKRSASDASVKAKTSPVSEKQVLRFVVKDYGKGIDRKDFDRIFKPFLQASAETERVYGGTGLGLAITAKLVHCLGGTISVDSEEGKWSKFIVDFPFESSPADIVGVEKMLEHATVLLVHDDTESLGQLKCTFAQYNTDYIRFKCMQELEAKITEQGFLSQDRSYICLVDESLYEEESYELLSNLAKSVLLTFGPNYSVSKATTHYRSLLQVLPSVLMRSLKDSLDVVKKSGNTALLGGSSRSFCSIPFKEMRVLIAEDNAVNQKVLSRMLKRLGIENVEIVDNGQKAVDTEAETEYDVVLMDMQMPVMDGLEACRCIQSRCGGHPRAKVVFVTAHVSNKFEAECFRAGGISFLSKPFNLREIDNCFQKLQLVDRKDDDLKPMSAPSPESISMQSVP